MIREARSYYATSYRVLSAACLLGAILWSVATPAIVADTSRSDGGVTVLSLTMLAPLMMLPEIFNDFFQFGGSFAKDTVQLDLLKTSVRGDAFYARMLRFDALRRAVTLLIAWLAGVLIHRETAWVPGLLFYILSSALLGIAIASFFIRRFGGYILIALLIYLAIVVTAALVAVGGIILVAHRAAGQARFSFLPGIFPAVLAALLLWYTCKRAIRQWKEQYHDAK